MKFITKKYIDKINMLEHQIENMIYEWNKEKELYDEIIKEKIYEQKVDFVIGGLDMNHHKEIHRPMYGLTEIDAFEIADKVKHKLKEQGFLSSTSYHWRKTEECFVIDVQVVSKEKQ